MDKQLIERIALEVAKDLVFPGFEIDAVMSSALTKYAGAFLARIDAERGKDAVAWFVNSEPVGRNPHYEQISKEYEGGIGTFPLFFSQTIPEGMALVPLEPTNAMKVAGDNAGFWCADKWRAMVSASAVESSKNE